MLLGLRRCSKAWRLVTWSVLRYAQRMEDILDVLERFVAGREETGSQYFARIDRERRERIAAYLLRRAKRAR
jgi:hypothetical protein